MATARGAESRWAGALRLGGWLTVMALWLWLRVVPSRVWYGAGLTTMPAFSPDAWFRHGHLVTIGGPLGYVAAWLSQWLCYAGYGALLLTALAGAAALAVEQVLTALAGRRLPGWRYAPALAFALLDGQYIHLVDWQLGWVVAFAAAAAWARWRETRAGVRLLVGLAGQALLYYMLGGPALVALPLLALAEVRRPAVAAGLLVWQAALPWVSTRCGCDRPLGEAYGALLAPVMANDLFGLARYASVGMVALAVLLGALASAAAAAPARRAVSPRVAWLGVVAGAVLLLTVGQDRVEGWRLALAQHAARREWTALLSDARHLRPDDLTQFEGYNLLLALTHTGQSGESLFSYPLEPICLLSVPDERLTSRDAVARLRVQAGQQLHSLELELGRVNNAEHETHEVLETQGTYTSLLLPMARMQVLKGRPAAAAVWLRLAAAQPLDPAGARPLLRALAADPTLAGDAEQAELARYRQQADNYTELSVAGQLEQLTREHPDHRLAWEYQLAWYLLTNQLDRLVTALPSLPRWGRPELPRHYEEAVLCWELLADRPAELGSWRLQCATRERFDRFLAAMHLDRDDARKMLREPRRPALCAQRVWRGAWSDTYYYYRLFGTSGAPR